MSRIPHRYCVALWLRPRTKAQPIHIRLPLNVHQLYAERAASLDVSVTAYIEAQLAKWAANLAGSTHPTDPAYREPTTT